MSSPTLPARARVPSTVRRGGWRTWLLAAALLPLGSRHATAASSVVELQPSAEAGVDRAIVGRLVQLELHDVEVPAPPGVRTTSRAEVVFVRVFAKGQELTIEMWERGELQGTRHLSLKGSPSLLARRVALAAGEMAEHLRDQRQLQWRSHRRQRAKLARQTELMPLSLRAAPQLWVEFVSGVVPEGRALLVGPRLSAGLRAANGAELMLGAAGLSLKLNQAQLDSWMQWYEVTARPGYGFRLSQASSLRLGMAASLATVHVSNGRLDTVDGMRSAETWSARAGAEAHWRWRWRPRVEFNAGLEASSVLRRLRLIDNAGEPESFGGAWFSGTLGIAFL
jgi:hypothetical protein